MSYILDALNKSESERQRQANPDLPHLASEPPSRRASWWMLLVPMIAGLLAAASVAVYVLVTGDETQAPGSMQPASQAASATRFQQLGPIDHPDGRGFESTRITQAGTPVETRAETQVASRGQAFQAQQGARSASRLGEGDIVNRGQAHQVQQGARSVSRLSVGDIATPYPPKLTQARTFADLPTAVQRRVPNFKVTSHIYSSDPSLRHVKIDGQTLSEGSLLPGGLIIEEITETGLLLKIDGYTFKQDIIQGWAR